MREAIDLQRATVLGLNARFGDFVTLGGDFQFERNVVGTDVKMLISANGAFIFLGSGQGTSDAAGVQIDNVRLGLVIFQTGATTSTFAVEASGDGALVGVDGLTLSGSLALRINGTGALVSEVITLGAADIPIEFIAGEETLKRVSGSILIELADFLAFSGIFAFELLDM